MYCDGCVSYDQIHIVYFGLTHNMSFSHQSYARARDARLGDTSQARGQDEVSFDGGDGARYRSILFQSLLPSVPQWRFCEGEQFDVRAYLVGLTW